MTFHSFAVAACAFGVVWIGLIIFDPSCVRGLAPDDPRVKWLFTLYLLGAAAVALLVYAVLM